MPYSFPIGYSESACYLVPIRAALIPFVAGTLRQLEARQAWQTEDDYESAYNAIAEYEACLMKACVDDLIESNNRLYRLMDAAFYGRTYTLADDDPLTIYPVIPAVPAGGAALPGLLARSQRIERVLDNGINGTFYAGEYESNTAMRNQLARIIELLEDGGTGEGRDNEILAELVKIVLALA